MNKFDVAIIGGGILGTSISYWISALYDLKICLIEKESDVAMHASSRNTGVVHSPFYLNPSSKKILAKSALISYEMWENLALKRNIPWKKTGVLELALDENQHKSLEEFMKWGLENGLLDEDLELLSNDEVSKREPNIKCHSAIFCKKEVSTDFGAFTREIKKESEKNGTTFLLGNKVKKIEEKKDDSKIVLDDKSEISSKLVINCAGGNSLDIAKQFGLAKEYSDLHFRGEYWVADSKFNDLVKTTVYTVAEFKGYPFLDPHWIKKADGTSEIGPNAVPIPSPDTYSGYIGDLSTSLSKLKDIVTGNAIKLLSDPEFLSLVSKEWLSSVSKTSMINRVQKFIPKIRPEYFSTRGTAGIRTPLITPGGKFLPDVLELKNNLSFHIINYNSPGATGAPAYSAFVVKKMQDEGLLDFTKKIKPSIWNFDDVLNQA
ncbi:MAG TPA: FAD-dependent oxidoreductase [Nitrosopumilaceae archaeon]|nr:FAD-dependent oxidoreductase [Nitrosopumilaceae archaeon]